QFDAVVIGVGNHHLVIPKGHSQRMLQSDVVAFAIHITEFEKTLSYNSFHLRIGLGANASNGTDFAVGEIEPALMLRDSAGLRQQGLESRSINDIFSTRSSPRFCISRLEMDAPDLVRSRHGNPKI